MSYSLPVAEDLRGVGEKEEGLGGLVTRSSEVGSEEVLIILPPRTLTTSERIKKHLMKITPHMYCCNLVEINLGMEIKVHFVM